VDYCPDNTEAAGGACMDVAGPGFTCDGALCKQQQQQQQQQQQ
jgi:hypothetical protein